MPVEIVTSQGDELIGNSSGTLISAVSVTASQTTADQINTSARGVKVVLDWLSGTGNVSLAIQAKDPTSGKYFTLLAGVGTSFVATNVYTVYPGLTAATNVTATDVLPRSWRVQVTSINSLACSYTVGYSLVV